MMWREVCTHTFIRTEATRSTRSRSESRDEREYVGGESLVHLPSSRWGGAEREVGDDDLIEASVLVGRERRCDVMCISNDRSIGWSPRGDLGCSGSVVDEKEQRLSRCSQG